MPKRKQKIKITKELMQDVALMTILNATHTDTQFICESDINYFDWDPKLYFPNNLKIIGNLIIIDRHDVELPKELIVTQQLEITNTNITSLSNTKSNSLILDDCCISITNSVKFVICTVYSNKNIKNYNLLPGKIKQKIQENNYYAKT